MVIDRGGLVFDFEVARSPHKSGSRCFLLGGVLRILIPNGLLEGDRCIGSNGENFRKTKLTDHISQLIVQIKAAFFL
jgi:hypothetical protein